MEHVVLVELFVLFVVGNGETLDDPIDHLRLAWDGEMVEQNSESLID